MGIDPGASGGIAVIAHSYDAVSYMSLKDKTLSDQYSFISVFSAKAYIEHVHSMPRDGVKSAFSFGRSYGNLEAFLVAAGIPFERVTPTVWQKEFGLIKKKGETKTQKKNRHKALAQELYPDIKVTHAIADALLIAEYGRRQQ